MGANGANVSKTIMTPAAILSFPHLFKPSAAPGSDKLKYSCSLVFPAGADLAELKQAALDAANEKFGADKVPAMLRSAKLRMPFRDDGADKGYPENAVYINVRSDKQPGVVGVYPGPDGRPMPITDETLVYAGCKVRATVRAFAYDTSGNRGVAFALNNVQKLADGDRLDGRRAAEDEFPADESAAAADLSKLL